VEERGEDPSCSTGPSAPSRTTVTRRNAPSGSGAKLTKPSPRATLRERRDRRLRAAAAIRCVPQVEREDRRRRGERAGDGGVTWPSASPPARSSGRSPDRVPAR
jgi:hypothetical protein